MIDRVPPQIGSRRSSELGRQPRKDAFTCGGGPRCPGRREDQAQMTVGIGGSGDHALQQQVGFRKLGHVLPEVVPVPKAPGGKRSPHGERHHHDLGPEDRGAGCDQVGCDHRDCHASGPGLDLYRGCCRAAGSGRANAPTLDGFQNTGDEGALRQDRQKSPLERGRVGRLGEGDGRVASIHRRGKKWRVCWRAFDGSQPQRTCPTRAAARSLQVEIEEEIAHGRDWQPGVIRKAPSVREVVEHYIREVVRTSAPGTALATARNLDIWLRWLEYVGSSHSIDLDVLSKQMLAEYFDSLDVGRHGKSRKVVTKKKLVHAVERFWLWVYDDDALAEFVPRPRTLAMPSGIGSPTLAPTWEEMDACVAAADGPLLHIASLLRYTGLRVQQVMGLRWDDLDLDGQTLTIRGELGKTQQEKRGRIIPVSSHLVELVSGWGRREGWLVGSNRTGKDARLARQRDMLRAWRRTGVREAVFKGHSYRSFRKGFQSGLKRLGADDEAVMYLVGHDLGVRGHYIDPVTLPLQDTVALIPPICDPEEVVELDSERAAKTANAVPTEGQKSGASGRLQASRRNR